MRGAGKRYAKATIHYGVFPMANCLICGVELDATTRSEEHIISNALGGVLTSLELICKQCNSDFGSGCDASLASDLKLFANLLNIERDRGVNRPLVGHTPTKVYKIEPAGKPVIVKPVIQVEETEKGKAIHIEARDAKQARQILEGLKRNHPEIDVEKALSQVQEGRRYLDEFVKLQFVFSGRESLRSIAKMAYFLLRFKHPEITGDYSQIVAFIKNESDYREAYFYYPAFDAVSKPPGAIFHSIVIKSYPTDKLLVAFVELYSSLSFVIVLSSDCSDNFQTSYVLDVLTRVEVQNPTITLPSITSDQLNVLFDTKPPCFQDVAKKFESFLKIALDRQAESHRSELIQRAMQNSLSKRPEGAPITEEMIDEFVNAFMEELTPLLVRNLKDTDE